MLSKFNKLLHFKYKKINSLLPILFDIFMLFKEYFMLTKYYGLLYFEDKKVIPSYFTPFLLLFTSKMHTIKALCNKADTSEHERQKLTSLSNVKNSYYNKSNTDLHFQYCWFGPECKGTSPTTQKTQKSNNY